MALQRRHAVEPARPLRGALVLIGIGGVSRFVGRPLLTAFKVSRISEGSKFLLQVLMHDGGFCGPACDCRSVIVAVRCLYDAFFKQSTYCTGFLMRLGISPPLLGLQPGDVLGPVVAATLAGWFGGHLLKSRSSLLFTSLEV